MPLPAEPDDEGLPLAGVRILDLTVVWAGPYATMHLADWGAEIIRIESISHFASFTRGTVARPSQAFVNISAGSGMAYPDDLAGEHPWNRSPIFNHHGRGKRSMTVDLNRPEGQAVFERLVANSDGLIENNLPSHSDELGLTWERLSKINPRFILMRVPAFGLDGPYRDYRTFGSHMEAIAGHPMIRAYPDLDIEYAPSNVPADAASGLDYTMNGRVWSQMGNDHWWLAPHNAYPCVGPDRWVTIVCRDEVEWHALCTVMQRADLAADPRFEDMAARYTNRRALDEEISTWTSTHDAHWVMEQLQRLGVPAGVVLHESELLRDRHLETRDYWQSVTNPDAGTQRQVGRLWHASETPHPAPRHAPLLGEDNDYVSRELLGYTAEEYEAFKAAGHVGTEYLPSVT
jgi:crotonobetainyl-CoA:carnitine CoA-transferase CaiB-like acyl-CoA transferase